MPDETFGRLLDLARAGATVVFVDHLASDVPGLGRLRERRHRLEDAKRRLALGEADGNGVRLGVVGKGRVLVGPNVERLLDAAGIHRESMVDHAGVRFIRRRQEGGRHYFISYTGATTLDSWMPLAVSTPSVAIMDPVSERIGLAQLRTGTDGQAEVYLKLEPGASLILRAFDRPVAGAPCPYLRPIGAPVELRGNWSVTFLAGGPVLPASFRTDTLVSWTERGDEEARRFAGTARYSIRFDAPGEASSYLLDLGRVAESARVRLNGKELGILFARPFRVETGPLRPTGNELEIEVTNLSANRIRDFHERLDLAPHRHLGGAGQHVAPPSFRRRRHRVLQVRVPDVAPELADGVFRLLFSRNERMMRVPQELHGRRVGLPQNLEQAGRVREVTVGLDQDRDALGPCVIAQLAQAAGDVRQHVGARHVFHVVVAEHAHVRRAERLGEVDEAAGFGELRGSFRGVHLVHLGRGAEVRDREAVPGELALRLLQASRGELGDLTQIHGREEPPQLDGDVAVRGSEVQDLGPGPGRAAQRREAEREPHPLTPSPFRKGTTWCQGQGEDRGGCLDELTTGRHRSAPGWAVFRVSLVWRPRGLSHPERLGSARHCAKAHARFSVVPRGAQASAWETRHA